MDPSHQIKLDDSLLKMGQQDFELYLTTVNRSCIIAIRSFVQGEIVSINERMRSLERLGREEDASYIKASHKRMHLSRKCNACDSRLAFLKPGNEYHLLLIQHKDGNFEYIPTSMTLLESIQELIDDHGQDKAPAVLNQFPLNHEQFMDWASKTQNAIFKPDS